MKRSRINPVGKTGKANLKARKMIAAQAEVLGLTSCEIKFEGCKGTFGIAPAHKERREFYRNDPDLLYHISQWVAACQYCHEILDNRAKTTKEESDAIFQSLRGDL